MHGRGGDTSGGERRWDDRSGEVRKEVEGTEAEGGEGQKRTEEKGRGGELIGLD